MAGTGPSEGFLSSYFRNPFKKKKQGEDIELPSEGRRDPRLPPKSRGKEISEGYSVFKKLGKKKEK